MKWNKIGKIALMVLTVAFIAQAGMRLWWPPPEKALALHPTLDVDLQVTWFTDEFDFAPKVTLLDLNGDPIDIAWMSYLEPSIDFTDFTVQFVNVPDACVRYKIEWLDVNHEYTGDPSPIEDWINWDNEEIVEQTHVWDWE